MTCTRGQRLSSVAHILLVSGSSVRPSKPKLQNLAGETECAANGGASVPLLVPVKPSHCAPYRKDYQAPYLLVSLRASTRRRSKCSSFRGKELPLAFASLLCPLVTRPLKPAHEAAVELDRQDHRLFQKLHDRWAADARYELPSQPKAFALSLSREYMFQWYWITTTWIDDASPEL